MEKETVIRTKLTAGEGMTLYNGENFGKTVYLGAGDCPENWQEIPDEEVNNLQAEKDLLE